MTNKKVGEQLDLFKDRPPTEKKTVLRKADKTENKQTTKTETK